LIEKSREFGRGVAYGTTKDFHLLNVPAAKMGAFPDAVEHQLKFRLKIQNLKSKIKSVY